MSAQVAKLNQLIAPVVDSLGCEFVGCELSREHGQPLLRVYADHKDGITVDHCASISRQLGAVFDVEDPFSGAYRLEVSSPGLDRPLFTLAHYQRFIGQRVRLKLRMALDGRRQLKGVLLTADEESVTVDMDGEHLTTGFANIEKANLIPDF